MVYKLGDPMQVDNICRAYERVTAQVEESAIVRQSAAPDRSSFSIASQISVQASASNFIVQTDSKRRILRDERKDVGRPRGRLLDQHLTIHPDVQKTAVQTDGSFTSPAVIRRTDM